MGVLPLVFSAGWASGVNAYGVVLALGLFGRLGLVHGAPPQLEHPGVLAAAAVMFAVEFVADKIPYVDSLWDAAHTVVRPLAGAWVGGLLGHDAATLNTAVGALVGGGTALASHGVKASLRLAVNTSPEPLSNILVSLAEDGAAIGVVVLALAHPWISAAVCALLLACGAAAVVAAARLVRRGLRALRARRGRAGGGGRRPSRGAGVSAAGDTGSTGGTGGGAGTR